MKIQYVYQIRWTPPDTQELLESVNNFMSEFGFHEKLVAKVTVGTHSVTSPVKLTSEQLQEYRNLAIPVFEEKLGGKIYLEDLYESVIEE